MSGTPENKALELLLIDPELDRMYREQAIAVRAAIGGFPSQLSDDVPVETEPKREVRPVETSSSSFGGL